jgi:nucleotide-binding universal stress UspA family protein
MSQTEQSAAPVAKPRHTIQRVLVPHDFSDTADAALVYALDLAEKLGARITIVHTYEIPAYGFPEGPAMTADMVLQIENAAQTALNGVAERSGRPGIQVDAVLRRGPAWSEIDAVAKETNADLIVIGTHGRRGVVRALLGSVAEKVVRTAPCPVLTVHGPQNHR